MRREERSEKETEEQRGRSAKGEGKIARDDGDDWYGERCGCCLCSRGHIHKQVLPLSLPALDTETGNIQTHTETHARCRLSPQHAGRGSCACGLSPRVPSPFAFRCERASRVVQRKQAPLFLCVSLLSLSTSLFAHTHRLRDGRESERRQDGGRALLLHCSCCTRCECKSRRQKRKKKKFEEHTDSLVE